MTFVEALYHLFNGEAIRLKQWPSGTHVIYKRGQILRRFYLLDTEVEEVWTPKNPQAVFSSKSWVRA